MDVIAVKDYPRTQYRAYWEIGIDRDTGAWGARIYDWDSGAVLLEKADTSGDVPAARLASQTWVKGIMDAFKR